MADPAASTTSSSPEPAGSPTSASSPPTRRRRRGWLLSAAVLFAVVVIVFAGLVATGVIPLFKSPPAPAPFAPTFQGAASEGQPTANAEPGGPWGAALGVAFRLPLTLTVPIGNLTGSVAGADGCNATLSPSLPKDVAVQGTPASAGAGASAFWVVLYVNSSGEAIGVMVNGGAASELLTLGGTSCDQLTKYLVPFPSGSPDSPAIIHAVNASGGSTYLAAHPNATEVFVGASVLLLEPLWGVVYTTCSITPIANTSGFEYNATVIGTTVEKNSTGPVSCSLPSGVILPTLAVPSLGAPALGKAI